MYLRAHVLLGALVVAAAGTLVSAQNSWVIPPGGDAEKNPSATTADVLKQGEMLFSEHCARCHGGAGLGDGPDGDPQMPPADLTDPYRAPINPDGTLYYKILNGKGRDMPAFKTELATGEIWAVVEYIKTLRKPE